MRPPGPQVRSGFLSARWRGEIAPERILFIDMLLIATAVNLATSFAAILVLGFKWPVWSSLLVYALPIPYNLFLTAALWRATDHAEARRAAALRAAALAWLALATLI